MCGSPGPCPRWGLCGAAQVRAPPAEKDGFFPKRSQGHLGLRNESSTGGDAATRPTEQPPCGIGGDVGQRQRAACPRSHGGRTKHRSRLCGGDMPGPGLRPQGPDASSQAAVLPAQASPCAGSTSGQVAPVCVGLGGPGGDGATLRAPRPASPAEPQPPHGVRSAPQAASGKRASRGFNTHARKQPKP